MRKRTLVIKMIPFVLLALLGLVSITQVSIAKPYITHVFNGAAGPNVMELLREEAKSFEKQYGIKVNVIYNEGYDKILVSMTGGAPPDVFDCWVGNYFAVFAKSGTLEDLTPYIKRDNFPIGEFYKPVANALKYKGKTLALPWGWGTVGTIYNKKMLSEAGLTDINTLPSGDWNWDAVSIYGKKLTKTANGKTKTFGIAAQPTLERAPMWVHQAGGMLFNEFIEPTKNNFSTYPAKTAFKFLSELFLVDRVALYAWDGIQTQKAAIDVGAFSGNHTWIYNTVGNKISIDVAPVPRGPKNGGSLFTMACYNIPKGSKKKELAWKWVKFLLRKQNQEKWMAVSGKLSPYRGFDHEYTKQPNFPEHANAYLKMAEDPDTQPFYDSSLRDFAPLGENLMLRLVTGKVSLYEWFDLADKEYGRLLSRIKR